MSKKISISPTGANSTSYSSTALTGLTTEQTILTQTIPALSLSSYRPFLFDIVFDITTPTLGVLPVFSLYITFATIKYAVITSVALSSLNITSKKFKIKGELALITDSLTAGTVFLDGEIRQNGGTLLALTATNTAFFNDFTPVNITNDQTFSVSVVTGTALTGLNILLKKARVGMP